jgi:hypothetical protein
MNHSRALSRGDKKLLELRKKSILELQKELSEARSTILKQKEKIVSLKDELKEKDRDSKRTMEESDMFYCAIIRKVRNDMNEKDDALKRKDAALKVLSQRIKSLLNKDSIYSPD